MGAVLLLDGVVALITASKVWRHTHEFGFSTTTGVIIFVVFAWVNVMETIAYMLYYHRNALQGPRLVMAGPDLSSSGPQSVSFPPVPGSGVASG
jgi:hypothetical protein